MYIYWTIGIIFGLLAIWAIGSYIAVRGLEEPAYSVLEKRAGYEIRQYEPYVIAETEVTGSFDEATNEGFRIIADYIFGNNTKKDSISMTTPVIEETSEKISMTTPVINTLEEESTRTISFVLPSKYTLESLPEPNNSRVTLTKVAGRKVAALSFTWYPTESRVSEKKATFINLLEKDGQKIIGAVQVARYNPPLSMPLVLRNEILIPIE